MFKFFETQVMVEKNPKLEKLEIFAQAKSKPAKTTIHAWKRERGAADLFMKNSESKAIFS